VVIESGNVDLRSAGSSGNFTYQRDGNLHTCGKSLKICGFCLVARFLRTDTIQAHIVQGSTDPANNSISTSGA
jgi:hypothetical protein